MKYPTNLIQRANDLMLKTKHRLIYDMDEELKMNYMNSKSKGIAVPDYDSECENCGQSPVVTIENESGDVIHRVGLCGPCCWGDSDCLDPDNWN